MLPRDAAALTVPGRKLSFTPPNNFLSASAYVLFYTSTRAVVIRAPTAASFALLT